MFFLDQTSWLTFNGIFDLMLFFGGSNGRHQTDHSLISERYYVAVSKVSYPGNGRALFTESALLNVTFPSQPGGIHTVLRTNSL